MLSPICWMTVSFLILSTIKNAKRTTLMDVTILKKPSVSQGVFTVLLLVQPLLDVLSYFMQALGATEVTTVLRTVLLFAISFYGFAISDRRRVYWILWAGIAGFWLLHAGNCLRIGYMNPLSDAGEYLKLVQFPLWTLSFGDMLRLGAGDRGRPEAVLSLDFLLILLIIALSFLTGMPEYTYAGAKIGLLGWFAVPTAQSAIVSMLTPALLLFAWRTQRLWVFCLAALLGFGLLYCTGTRLAYYSAILIAAAFLPALLLAGGKQRLCCIPLVLVLAVLVLCRNSSPMAQRRAAADQSYDMYQAQTDRIMGKDKDFVYTGGELPEEVAGKIRRVYEEVYTQENALGQPLLGDLLDRFGTERVMAHYDYTTRASVLYHTRTKKLAVLEMVWEEEDLPTRILGMEYANSVIHGNPYDPENDFPALFYYYGYLGTGLYLLFAGYFLAILAAGLFRNLRRLADYITPELTAFAVMFCLGLGAAQFSGNVLRRPSVIVYLALAGAAIGCCVRGGRERKLFARYESRPSVTMKKL